MQIEQLLVSVPQSDPRTVRSPMKPPGLQGRLGIISGFDDNLESTTTMETLAKLDWGDKIFVTMSIQGHDSESGMLSFKLTPTVIFTGHWISEF